MDLINFLRVLSRRKWLILAISSVAVITTFLIARQAPRVYQVSAQLSTGLTEYNTPFSLTTRTESPQKYEVEMRLKYMVEMIRTPQVLSLVSYQLFLHDIEKVDPFRSLEPIRNRFTAADLENARRNFQQKLDSIQPLRANDPLDRQHMQILEDMGYDARSLRSTLNVSRIPGTDLIEINYAAETPLLVAFVSNTLCQEFVRYHTRSRAQQSKKNIDFLTRDVETRRGELEEKLREWENYRKNNGITQVVNPVSPVLNRIERLETEREYANEQLERAENQLAQFESQYRFTLPAVYSSGFSDKSEETTELVKMRETLLRLNSRFVQSDFKDGLIRDSILNVTSRMGDLMFQLALEQNQDDIDNIQIKTAIQQQILVLITRDRIKSINREMRRLTREPVSFSGLDQDASTYAQEVERARDAYLLSLTKLNETLLSSQEIDPGTVHQVAIVQPPDVPEPSKTLLLVILSGFVSLSLGVVVTFILEYLDTSIKFPSHFQSLTGLPLFGTLNRLHTNNLDLVSLFAETQKNKSLETYKQLLRKIRFKVIEEWPRTMLITSTKDGSGKTSLMVSLAYAMSLNDKKVLLIDTNFKDNSLTKIVGATPSLEKFLNQEISRRKLISNSVFDNVDIIGCEGGDLSPDEVFPEDGFENLLLELSEQYDFIIMEGPPLNDYSDSRELAQYAGKVLPVFSASAGINQRDKESIEYLTGLEDRLMGAVLNKVEMSNLNL